MNLPAILKLCRLNLELLFRRKRKLGIAVILGVSEIQPIINIPTGVLRVRVRLRMCEIGLVFLKFPDRIEKWVLLPANGKIDCKQWKIGNLQAVTQLTKP